LVFLFLRFLLLFFGSGHIVDTVVEDCVSAVYSHFSDARPVAELPGNI
jgi:hypothetical protein